MTVTVNRIDVRQFSTVLALLYAVVGIVLAVIVLGADLAGLNGQPGASLGAWVLVVFPAVNMVLGFAAGVLLAATYNLIAPRIGGIRVETSEVSESSGSSEP
jgi:hypothetical protein